MESHNIDEVEYDAFSMNKSSEADTVEDSETVGIYNGHGDEISDPMTGSARDDADYVEAILAEFERTQDLLEDVECRLSVAAMVSDAVTNGIANALLEESSEALAAKEAEIVALNDKLEDRDFKLWNLTEKLQLKEQELAMHIVESNSDRERLVSDFMYGKERMKRRLYETDLRCVEKEKQLLANTEITREMVLKLEADRNKIIAMQEHMKCLQEKENVNRLEISDLVQQLERVKSQHESGNGSLMEEDLERVISKYGGQLVEKEECEAQMFRHEIEIYICESIYEGQLLELKHTLEADRLQSRTVINSLQQEIENLKVLSEIELKNKSLEILDLVEQLKENEVSNALQTSVIVGVLETSFQESRHQISEMIGGLRSKDDHINSLTSMLQCIKQDFDSLQAQISSSHVMDAEIENNLSTLKAKLENQCTQLNQELEEERARVRDDLSRITRLQTLNDNLAARLREQQISLEQVEEKQAEHQWQQGIECLFLKEVYGSKLNESLQLITSLNVELEKKVAEADSYLESNVGLEEALKAERSEVLRLQESLNGFESHFGGLNCTDLQKVDSAFDNIDMNFLKMTLRLDSFEKNSKMCFENIQSHVTSLQEEFQEKQWKQNFEEEINGLVLREFLHGLEGHLKAIEQEKRKSRAIQVRWDEGRVALMSEIKNLHQELHHLKFDEPTKVSFTADSSNSNGFQFFSHLTQEVQNREATDGQRKDRIMRRFSTGQVCADTSKSDDSCVSPLTREENNEEANDGQRKDWVMRRFSTGQLSTDALKLDDSCVGAATRNVVEGQLEKELDLYMRNFEIADNPDSPLKNMSKDQLISHFKRVVAELKRQTECMVVKQTEEIYRLKRDLLNGKNSMNMKKDKELNALKKRIAEITKKLDNVVEENDKLSSCVVEDRDQNYELVCKLKDEMQAEKRHLLEKVREKENNLKALSDKLSDALRKEADFSLREANLLNRITDLESESDVIDIIHLYEVDILITLFKETVEEKELNFVLKVQEEHTKQKRLLESMRQENDRALDLACGEKEEHKKQREDLMSQREVIDLMNVLEKDIISTLYKETVKEKEFALNLKMEKLDENVKQKWSLEKKVHEEDRAPPNIAFGEKEELKKQIVLLEKLGKEKDNFPGLALSQLEEIERFESQKVSSDLGMQHCEELKKQIVQLETIIREKDDSTGSVRGQQEELIKEVISLKEDIEKKDKSLKMILRDLEQARKENTKLEEIIEGKENMIDLSLKKEQSQRDQFETTLADKENAFTLAARNIEEQKEMVTSLQETLKHRDLCLQQAVKDKEEGEKQKCLLQVEVQGVKAAIKRMRIQTETTQKQYQRELTEFVCKSIDTALQLEHVAVEKIGENMSRLEQTKQHLIKLREKADAYVLSNSYYKDKLEKECCNLQKAEEEVDLLGDEVDALLSLLEKVYAALDHYLPVLQHYPGIVDLIKLIKTELMDHDDAGLKRSL